MGDTGARRRACRAVLAAVALAALLRAPSTFAGLPYVHHSDEPVNVRIVERMAAERDANPRNFTYPALMFDIGALVLAPFVDADDGRTGDALVQAQTPGNARATRPGLVVALRWAVGVLPGLVAVGAAGATAWLVCRRWWAAGLAAGLAAVSPLDLRFGPPITPDALSGAASALAILAAVGVAVGARPPPEGSTPSGPRPLLSGGSPSEASLASEEPALAGVPAGEPGAPLSGGPALGGPLASGGPSSQSPARPDARSETSPGARRPLRSRHVPARHLRTRPPPARRPLGRYLLAGAAVGAAAAAKYNAVLSAAALAMVHVTSGGRASGRRPLARWWLPVAAGLAGLAVFLALNPFAPVEAGAFADGLQFEGRHYRRGHPGSDEGSSLGFHLAELWRSSGPALLLVPLAPLARTAEARRAALAILAFVAAYVGFVSTFEVRFARNLLPVTGPVAAAAALGAVALVERLASPGRRSGRAPDRAAEPGRAPGRDGRVAGSIAAVVCAATLAWPAVAAGRAVDAAVDDPWARARAWMDEHVEPGSRVAVESYGVWVDPERYRVTALRGLSARDADWYRDQGFDLLVAGESHFGRFLDEPDRFPEAASAYRELFERTCTPFAAGPDGERVLLLALRPCR